MVVLLAIAAGTSLVGLVVSLLYSKMWAALVMLLNIFTTTWMLAERLDRK